MTGPGTHSKLGPKLKLEGRSRRHVRGQAAHGFSSFEGLDFAEVPMGYFFPEAPRALAVRFSCGGQTRASTMGLLVVSPGKRLRGKGRMPLCVQHCPGRLLGDCFNEPGSEASRLCPQTCKTFKAHRDNVEKH